MEIRYIFGRRQSQDLPEYSSGAYDPFVFTVTVDAGSKSLNSWQSAYALLGFFRKDFVRACINANTSSQLNLTDEAEIWIPNVYLDRPTIEIKDSMVGKFEELLIEGEKPNPWLSLST